MDKLAYLVSCNTIIRIDVVLEFQNSTFSTTEGTAAEVCVQIEAGMIARPVVFTVTPSDGTATGRAFYVRL